MEFGEYKKMVEENRVSLRLDYLLKCIEKSGISKFFHNEDYLNNCLKKTNARYLSLNK